MTITKRRVTLTLDADLLDALEELDSDDSVSAQVNDALRLAVDKRRRVEGMRAFLAEQEAIHGPVDEEALARANELFG